MKKIMVVVFALIATSAMASKIEGDKNNDGVLSGEEQYFLANPAEANVTVEWAHYAVKYAEAEQEAARQQAENDRLIYQRQQRENRARERAMLRDSPKTLSCQATGTNGSYSCN